VSGLYQGVSAVEFFIATDGNDAWEGTRARPLATLEGAREAIRALKRTGPLPADGVTVWLRGGVYPRTESFTLEAEDSGTADTPIVYRACAGEEARLVGGRPVTGWTPVTDPAVLARLDPAARGRVLQTELPAQGISDFGALQSRGFGRQRTPAHLELFFDGRVMTLARWPNDGFSTIAGFPPATGEDDSFGDKIGNLEAGYHYDGDRPARWRQTGDIWAHGYWAYDWANSYERIAAIDPAVRLIKTVPPGGLYGFRKDQRVYYLNILEELDQPGEYYLDRQTGILYCWPPAPVEGREIYVSLLEEPLAALRDVSHVTLRGLTFEYARGTAVTVNGGNGVTVDGCTLRNLGNYGVIVEGGTGHRVAGCDLYNLGDGGIILTGGDRRTLTPGGHEAVNNHIHHIAQWSKCYQPAVMLFGVGNRVAHNLIHDHPHCAVLIHGNEHVVEYNDIHHVALETGDVGAFYIGRDWAQQGNIVRYNFFHETGGVGMGSMAIYLDDCSSGVTIFGNIFYRTKWAAFIGGGRDNVVENNIFVECTPAVHIDGRGLDTNPTWHDMVYKFMKERLEEMHPHEPPYSTRYPKLAALDQYYARPEQDGIPPESNSIEHNIFAGGQPFEIAWHATAELQIITENLLDIDPRFVDPARLNFQLRDDSPAYCLGFQRIPVEEIGLERKGRSPQVEG